ncbi:retinol dehydrogenase 14 [Pyrenophora tritici-repentis]|nr:retinol dehydrogenase 14 [Pyrenophora tritici-repentis]
MSSIQFDPATDIPDQSGRVFLITGGTTGLGASTVSFLPSHNPAHIFFSGRNKARADELISKISKSSPSTKITFIECDLASLASVQSAAKQVLSLTNRLDVLICNAGIMATPSELSKDGYELQFATNHLGHALLMKLLLPLMLETTAQPNPDVRIVNLSSVAYKAGGPSSGIDYGPFYNPMKWVYYNQSKLANLLYSVELAARHPSITSVAVHPGFIKTDLLVHINSMDRQVINLLSHGDWRTAVTGAYNQTWAATTQKENLVNGAYYEPVGVKTVPSTRQGRDRALAKELWEWTERELKDWN